MQNMTIEQLRTAANAGGVAEVTLKGEGGDFLIHINMVSGGAAVLAKARSSVPRRFANPTTAVNALREAGITLCRVDAAQWNPNAKARSIGQRGQALRKAHQAAAYVDWLAAEIQKSIDDPRPSIPHEDVMARMDARITYHMKTAKKNQKSPPKS